MPRPARDEPVVTIPPSYPTALLYVDESGSRASGSRFFVMSAVKVRKPGALARATRVVRDRNQFEGEFKFSEITKGTLSAYYDLIDTMAASDAHLIATVVNRDLYDPFPGKLVWQGQAEVAAQLVRAGVNRRELVSVLMDGVSTPEGIALDDEVRRMVNRSFRSTSVVTCACLDSRSNDGLQMADLLAGAIASERRRAEGEHRKIGSNPNSPKTKVARRLIEAFEIEGLMDQRSRRPTSPR